MNEERTLQEIEQHADTALPNAKEYRVAGCKYEEDFESHSATLILILKRFESGEVRRLRFTNPNFNAGPPFGSLSDASGLYLMDTSHLGWGREQRIEVGDWDGGPPLFWASDMEEIENDAPTSQCT